MDIIFIIPLMNQSVQMILILHNLPCHDVIIVNEDSYHHSYIITHYYILIPLLHHSISVYSFYVYIYSFENNNIFFTELLWINLKLTLFLFFQIYWKIYIETLISIKNKHSIFICSSNSFIPFFPPFIDSPFIYKTSNQQIHIKFINT